MDIFDEQTLELTLKASNEGTWDWNRNTNEIFYSKRVLEFLGYTSSTPPNIMTHAESIVHEDDLKYFKGSLDQVLQQTSYGLLKIDCRVVQPSGEIRWIRMRGIVTRGKAKATRITGSMIDISKRKFAEEMIKEEQHMLRLIIDNIPLQIYFKDKESCYKLVNQQQVEWLGKETESQLIGHCSKEFFSPDSWASHREKEINIMLSGESIIDAIQKEEWPNRDDTYVKTVKHPWYDSTNKLLGIYGISCDVTNLIEAKKELEKLAVSLQQQNKNNQEELLLAKEIQRAILPHNTPSWDQLCSKWKEKLNIQTLYEPASELAGDFYDIITFPDNKLGFLIIDVTWHGVTSAMIISLIKGLMEHANHLASQPAKYLEEINNGLSNILKKTSLDIFALASYTLIDFDSNKITTVSAGDNAPLFIFKESYETDLQENNHGTSDQPALGTNASIEYSEQTFSLNSIKSILLYTDGIFASSKKGKKTWGIKELTSTYQDAQSQTKIPPLEYILNTTSEYSSRERFQDDVCMVNLNIQTPSLNK